MKRILLCLLTAGAFLAPAMAASILMAQGPVTAAQPAAAQQVAANKPQIPVAVVDYEYLVLVHPNLYATKNALQERIKLEEQKLLPQRQKLLDVQKKLQLAQPGTQEFMQLTTELRRMDAEGAIEQEKIGNELQMEQIYAFYGAYKDIKECVEAYAVHNNILVVINSPDITKRLPNESASSLRSTVMQAEFIPTVMWVTPNLDMTMHIEGMINQKYANLPKVDFNMIKNQMYGTPAGNGAGVGAGTSVATGPVNPQGQQPRQF